LNRNEYTVKENDKGVAAGSPLFHTRRHDSSEVVFMCCNLSHRKEGCYVNANEKRRILRTYCTKAQTERDKGSSCCKCPYRRVYGLKCFPCMRHILGDKIPELEGKKYEQTT
jgi:hypothetical protein